MASWGQMTLMDEANFLMYELHYFHDLAMMSMVMLGLTICLGVVEILISPSFMPKFASAHVVEGTWIFMPGVIMCILALPSMTALFLIDDLLDPMITIKVTGRQWYWSYEYSDFGALNFDSYMIPEEDLVPGMFRLLEVDHRTVIPLKVDTRLLVSAGDVLHSWTIPSLSLKIDAVPGRMNQLMINFMRPGVFYGQCSEICGANHSFMPIVMEVTSLDTFLRWVATNLDE